MYCVAINSEEIKAAVPITRKGLRLSTNERIAAWRIATVPIAPMEDLIVALYGWDFSPSNDRDCVQVLICRLRHKLGPIGELIQNSPRVGYYVAAHNRPILLDVLSREIAEVAS